MKDLFWYIIFANTFYWPANIFIGIFLSGIFKKAGEKPWMAFVPFFWSFKFSKISLGSRITYPLLIIIALCNFYFVVVLFFLTLFTLFLLGRTFNKSFLFCIGLMLFPFAFLLILSLSDAEYDKTKTIFA